MDKNPTSTPGAVQVTIDNPGRAIVHLQAGRRQAEKHYEHLKNCPKCRQEERDSARAAVQFYTNLIQQLLESR